MDSDCGGQRLLLKVDPTKIVDERRIEEQAIQSIKHTAMARQNLRSVFGTGAAFKRTLCQIADYSQGRHDRTQGQGPLQGQVLKEPKMRYGSQ